MDPRIKLTEAYTIFIKRINNVFIFHDFNGRTIFASYSSIFAGKEAKVSGEHNNFAAFLLLINLIM